jgi:DNA-binding MarR family transcriptional regulator
MLTLSTIWQGKYMSQRTTDTFYLSLVEFLMTAKHYVVAIGDEFGLTSIQALTLLLVDALTPRPMTSFCTLFHCDASNVTGIIDGLESKGLVSRQNDVSDRRIKTIRLEPAGRRLQQTIIARLDGMNGPLFAPLDDAEKALFAGLVAKIAAGSKPAGDVPCPAKKAP